MICETETIAPVKLLLTAEEACSALIEPDEVVSATGSYRAAMDTLGQFVDECCVLEAGAETKASDVRDKYEQWCKSNGERPINGRRFGDYLTDRGVIKRKSNGTWYTGIVVQ